MRIINGKQYLSQQRLIILQKITIRQNIQSKLLNKMPKNHQNRNEQKSNQINEQHTHQNQHNLNQNQKQNIKYFNNKSNNQTYQQNNPRQSSSYQQKKQKKYNQQQYPNKFKNINVENLPHQIHQLIKRNKFLQKQNQFLQQQLKEKDLFIQNLKKQIYDSIIQETQNKLHCLKIIEQQSQLKAKQIIEIKMSKFYQNDEEVLKLRQKINEFQTQLKKERKTNEILATNVVELKEYIIQAMEEKDLIIYQLKQMIITADDAHNRYQEGNYAVNDNQKTKHLSRGKLIKSKDEKFKPNYHEINAQNVGNIKETNKKSTVKAKIVRNI